VTGEQLALLGRTAAHLRPAHVAHRARPRTQLAAPGRTATRAVRGRLAQNLPPGYSATVEVVEVGSAVSGPRPGQLVATGGVRAALDQVRSPKFLVYRVAAEPIPNGHWCTDRRQGGRLLVEVCHFVCTAQALIGADIKPRNRMGRGGPDEAQG
jgi:hypothetical protein